MKNNYKTIITSVCLIIALAVLTFTFIFNKCTVIYDAQGGSDIAAVEIQKNKTLEKPIDPVRVGYQFQGWFLEEEEFNFDTPITKDITLVAKWKKLGD
ncbi:MAG: hypothetical protein E7172_06090 [Firmicutes bacterium]|nr:hypothetical protein [Bacillota bacterium]